MGVLNVTPDSFYPDSRTRDISDAVSKAAQMEQEGADVLDIGGESTRPGASQVDLSTELERVIPVIQAIHQRLPHIPISIDTQKAEVARQALASGAQVINDISALRHDPEMAAVVAQNGARVVLMHMQGTPATMQKQPTYDDVIEELQRFFADRIEAAVRQGIAEDKIILDPGIGFGKTLAHNLAILQNLSRLKSFGRPLLVGISRKSFIGLLIAGETHPVPPPEARLEGTLAATLWALNEGATGLRVHDVAPTRQAIQVWQGLKSQ